jgi:hypothetical protein
LANSTEADFGFSLDIPAGEAQREQNSRYASHNGLKVFYIYSRFWVFLPSPHPGKSMIYATRIFLAY